VPRSSSLAVLAPGLALAFATPAGAESAGFLARALALQGDPAWGAYLASECVTCHSATGVDRGIPAIVGLPTEALIEMLVSYKFAERLHPVMQNVTATLGEAEIASIALHIATLTKN
jgi:cytochrome c